MGFPLLLRKFLPRIRFGFIQYADTGSISKKRKLAVVLSNQQEAGFYDVFFQHTTIRDNT